MKLTFISLQLFFYYFVCNFVNCLIKLGYEQRPGLLFPNESVLSKLIVGLGDYAFNSKSDSRLCGCSLFE